MIGEMLGFEFDNGGGESRNARIELVICKSDYNEGYAKWRFCQHFITNNWDAGDSKVNGSLKL